MIKPSTLLTLLSAIAVISGHADAAASGCQPPRGFVDTPSPEIEPGGQLVSHTEEIVVDRPLVHVLHVEATTKLEDTINRKSPLPGVSGTFDLTPGGFGQEGSRRLTCLTDGSSLVEQVLLNKRDQKTAEFRYVVWNYTSTSARAVRYGIGHFVRTDLGDGRTHVRWTYSFRLEPTRFPGRLGGLGRLLFRLWFLERDYAKMMRGTLAGSKARIGRTPARSGAQP